MKKMTGKQAGKLAQAGKLDDVLPVVVDTQTTMGVILEKNGQAVGPNGQRCCWDVDYAGRVRVYFLSEGEEFIRGVGFEFLW